MHLGPGKKMSFKNKCLSRSSTFAFVLCLCNIRPFVFSATPSNVLLLYLVECLTKVQFARTNGADSLAEFAG
jgi:hypothetical protein